VIDRDGVVLGVVSEGDIVSSEEGYEPFHDPRRPVSTAGEAMTAPPVTVERNAPVAAAARLMVERGINRLPVVDDRLLVGIVTRADLVRAFVRSDEEIAREISDDVLSRTLWLEPADVAVDVDQGRVVLSGRVATRTQAELAAAYSSRVPGVVAVDATALAWIDDDLAARRGEPA
jgi:CBS domain-containing protein